MRALFLLTVAGLSASAHPTSSGEPIPHTALTTPDYSPKLASASCFPSYEEAVKTVRRAEGGAGFAHFDDWGVLTTYDANGHAIEHGVVAWQATVEYFERLNEWHVFSRTGHLDDVVGRNLTDSAEERIRLAREEKKEQGEQAWPRVPFECRGNSAPLTDSEAFSTTELSVQQSNTRPSTADSPTAISSAPKLPPLPSYQRRIPLWCTNTPCSSDADCRSQGCDAHCIMRDRILFLSCAG